MLALLVLVLTAWVADEAVASDRAARNLTVEGINVSRLSPDDLGALADRLNADLATQPVTIVAGDEEFVSDPVSLGIEIDRDTLVNEALDARRGGFLLWRPFWWLKTLFTEENIAAPYVADPAATTATIDLLVNSQLDKPVEPVFQTDDSGLITVIPGAQGAMVDAGKVAEQAIAVVESRQQPYVVIADLQPVDPALETRSLLDLAADANVATASAITIRVEGQSTTVDSSQLREWIVLDIESEPPSWSFDNATMIGELVTEFPQLGGEDQQAHFDVVNNRPIIVPPSEAIACCADDSAETLKEALVAGRSEVQLEAVVSDPDASIAALEELGITEQVSVQTTKHPCCQPRVTNIHQIADIVRGAVVRPGEVFSLNGYVGRRTEDRGFVPAGAIAEGVLEDQVGGGVSQFATTLFNAAYYAGLDFVEYQSHSLYFSRYPRGREATVSWPRPDLAFRNNTPYGILIWPTYTDTSISVTFFSTRYIRVEDAGQTEGAQGACTRVTTYRDRTYPDGTTDRDSVFAVYRPAQGLNCAGEPTRPDLTTTTTEPSTTESTDSTDPSSTDPSSTESTAPPDTPAPSSTTEPESTTSSETTEPATEPAEDG